MASKTSLQISRTLWYSIENQKNQMFITVINDAYPNSLDKQTMNRQQLGQFSIGRRTICAVDLHVDCRAIRDTPFVWVTFWMPIQFSNENLLLCKLQVEFQWRYMNLHRFIDCCWQLFFCVCSVSAHSISVSLLTTNTTTTTTTSNIKHQTIAINSVANKQFELAIH